jgi:hypothetical protein
MIGYSNKKLLFGIAGVIFTVIVVAAMFLKGSDFISYAALILFLLIFLPLEILGYYKFRQFLNKKGVKTCRQADREKESLEAKKLISKRGAIVSEGRKVQDDIDTFLDEIGGVRSHLTTNIFLNSKNKF